MAEEKKEGGIFEARSAERDKVERSGAGESGAERGGFESGGVKTLREEYAEIIEAKLAIDSLVEQALKTWLNFNPIDRLKDYLSSEDETIRKASMEKIQSQVTRHIDMFNDMLEEAKEVPVELLRKAMEVATTLRKK